MQRDNILSLLQECVEMLVDRKFAAIESAGMSGRLTTEEIQGALDDYPGTLTLPLTESYQGAHVYELCPEGWRNVEFELWYDGEVSDLTLSARVREGTAGQQIQIQDIHVL